MSSMGSPNSWAPYDSYRDCSQGICSTYCPQWCYFIFPPPPPFAPEEDSGTNFSPLIIAVIGILASAFLLATYYILISKYCKRRMDQNQIAQMESNRNQTNHRDQWQVAPTGLDEALIDSITVCKYKKGDGLVEGAECAVCLGEFQEGDSLRLLPKCDHAFHLPCIDTWLKSHSNCPLCRASVVSGGPLPIPAPSVQSSSGLNISSLEIQHQNDLILVVDDQERVVRGEEVVVGLVSDVVDPKNTLQAINEMENSEFGQEGVEKFRRSVSLGSFSCPGHLFVADILHINEDYEDKQMQIHQLSTGIGSSQGIWGENGRENDEEMVALKRSLSTGRFMFTWNDKGKNSIIPI